jgi:hypothetical protein
MNPGDPHTSDPRGHLRHPRAPARWHYLPLVRAAASPPWIRPRTAIRVSFPNSRASLSAVVPSAMSLSAACSAFCVSRPTQALSISRGFAASSPATISYTQKIAQRDPWKPIP